MYDNTNRCELQNEIDALKAQIKHTDELIESECQELHNVQRAIDESKAHELALKEEIDFLKKFEDPKHKALVADINKLEADYKLLQEEHTLKSNKNHHKISILNEQIKIGDEKLKFLQKIAQDSANSKDSDSLKYKKDTEIDVESVSTQIEVIQDQIQQKILNNEQLKHRIKETENEAEHLQETFQFTLEELQTSKDAVEDLQNQLSELRVEIFSKKSTPLDDASRGNSMFVEVHDKKVQLETQYQTIQSECRAMQTHHANLLSMIKVLSAENKKLSTRYMEGRKNEVAEHERLNDIKAKIDELKVLYKETRELFKKSFECQTKDLSEGEWNVLINFYKRKEKELLNILDELLALWECQLDLACKTAVVNNDYREIQHQTKQMESRINQLQAEFDDLCLNKNINPHCVCKKDLKSNKLGIFKMFGSNNQKQHT